MFNILEALRSNIYSDREAKIDLGYSKKSSQDTPEEIVQKDGSATLSSSTFIGSTLQFVLTNKSALIDQWREMSYYPEVDEAIQELTNDAFVMDESGERPININLDGIDIPDNLKKSIQSAFDKILNIMEFRHRWEEYFKTWYIDGSLAFEVIYDNKHLNKGIQGLKLLPSKGFYKIIDPKTKKVRYFLDTKQVDANAVSLNAMYTKSEIVYIPEQIAYITSGVYSKDRLFPLSFLSKASKVLNDVIMIEEALLIYRFTRAPSRNAIYVDTGRLSKTKSEQYLKDIMNKHRNRATYNTSTGQIENRKRSIPMQEDMWFGVSGNNRSTRIEPIGGNITDVSEIADLDYFWRKLWGALNVPVNRRDPNSRGNAISFNNTETENDEIKFFKFVLKLRDRFNRLFIDLLKKELLITRVFSLRDWNRIEDSIKFVFKNNNEYARNKTLQNYSTTLDIASTALDLSEQGLVSKKWVSDNIMGFTEDERKEIDAELADEADKPGTDSED